ncbi:MAG: alpha/beta hydrolase family protein [Bacillus sp. (in: firmicutes)]
MHQSDGKIISCIPYPSAHPEIRLFTVTYLSDGLKVKGLLAVPEFGDREDGFLYLRGGIKSVGKVRPGRIIQFASHGFVVFAPHYRGNSGGEGREDFAGEDRNDALAALKVLMNLGYVKKLHVFGFSRGGIMALWAALGPEKITSLVTWGGVSDMVRTYRERVDLRRMMKRVIGGSPDSSPELYAKRNPIGDLDHIHCPVLIIHGCRDQNVSVEHALLLEEKLKEHGKQVETWYFPQYTHYFPPTTNRATVERLTSWMKAQSSMIE